MNEEDQKNIKIDKLIETLIYIISLSFIVIYTIYNIYNKESIGYIIRYDILGLSFIIFGFIWHHIVSIKPIHRKIYIEETFITISFFVILILLKNIVLLFFLVFPTIVFSLIMLGINLRETTFYIIILILGTLAMILDPTFSNTQEKFYLIIYLGCIISSLIININYFSIYRTFTDKYKNEVSLKVQGEEINNEKDSFFEIASQELVSPIQLTQDQTEKIIQKYRNMISENILNTFNKTLTNIEILKQLSENMLSIKNLNIENIPFDIKPIDLSTFINQVTETMQPKASERNIKIITNLDKSINYINADQNRLGEIMRNLIDNSIKYSDQNTTIELSSYYEDNLKVIEIKDQGIGIPKDDIPHLFEKFYRASNVERNTKQGSGIGLYLVKEYLNKMNAEIKVESEINKGSKFKILFKE